MGNYRSMKGVGSRQSIEHIGARMTMPSFDNLPTAVNSLTKLTLRFLASKYLKDAQTTGRVQLSLTVGCQLAFAAGIYPPQSEFEKNAIRDVLESRLGLIDDYHLAGKRKKNMVRCLIPISLSGKNDLFTVPKSYPHQYDLDERGRPMKRVSEHTARKVRKKR